MPWQLQSSTAWLGYTPSSGADSARVMVAPVTTSLSPGLYTGRVEMTAVPGVSPSGIVVLYKITSRTGVGDVAVPANAMLGQNYPNPASGYTTIPIVVPSRCRMEVALYDVYGRRVTVLHDGMMEAGSVSLPFDASALAAGMYFVKLVDAGRIETKVLVVRR